MPELILIKKGGIERRVPESHLDKWKERGFIPVDATEHAARQEGEATKGEKPLSRMSTAELEAKAQELGLTFPEDLNTNPKRAAFLTEHAAKQE